MSEHLEFKPNRFNDQIPNTKEKTFHVVNKRDNLPMGTVGWFSSRNKFCFFPNASCGECDACYLRDIADFCESLPTE